MTDVPRFSPFSPIDADRAGVRRGLVSWSGSALASIVFFTARVYQRFLDVVLGFAGGVMLAASFWSLLHPAIELSADYGPWRWFRQCGHSGRNSLFHIVDEVLPRLQLPAPGKEALGPPSHLRADHPVDSGHHLTIFPRARPGHRVRRPSADHSPVVLPRPSA